MSENIVNCIYDSPLVMDCSGQTDELQELSIESRELSDTDDDICYATISFDSLYSVNKSSQYIVSTSQNYSEFLLSLTIDSPHHIRTVTDRTVTTVEAELDQVATGIQSDSGVALSSASNILAPATLIPTPTEYVRSVDDNGVVLNGLSLNTSTHLQNRSSVDDSVVQDSSSLTTGGDNFCDSVSSLTTFDVPLSTDDDVQSVCRGIISLDLEKDGEEEGDKRDAESPVLLASSPPRFDDPSHSCNPYVSSGRVSWIVESGTHSLTDDESDFEFDDALETVVNNFSIHHSDRGKEEQPRPKSSLIDDTGIFVSALNEYCCRVGHIVIDDPRVAPPPDSKYARTIVFDIDETLLNATLYDNYYQVTLRPGARSLLQLLNDLGCEIIVWSAGTEGHVQNCLSLLDKDTQLIKFAICRGPSWFKSCPIFKRLDLIPHRSKDSLLLIENNCAAAYEQLENTIIVDNFYSKHYHTDAVLFHLAEWLPSVLHLPNLNGTDLEMRNILVHDKINCSKPECTGGCGTTISCDYYHYRGWGTAVPHNPLAVGESIVDTKRRIGQP